MCEQGNNHNLGGPSGVSELKQAEDRRREEEEWGGKREEGREKERKEGKEKKIGRKEEERRGREERIREREEKENRKASSMVIKLLEKTYDYKNDHNKMFFKRLKILL